MGFLSAAWGIAKSVGKACYVSCKKIAHGVWNLGKRILTAAQQAFQNFLHKARDFLRVVIQKIQVKIAGTLVGAAHVLKKVGDKCLELSRNYSVDPELGTWKETTVKRIIDEKDLPPEIQQKLQQQEEVNNTKTLNEALVCEM